MDQKLMKSRKRSVSGQILGCGRTAGLGDVLSGPGSRLEIWSGLNVCWGLDLVMARGVKHELMWETSSCCSQTRW